MSDPADTPPGGNPHRPLTEAERQALAEAQARREAYDKRAKLAETELNGPRGEEPTRYGDWEKDGVVTDF